MPFIQHHVDYAETLPDVELVRRAVEGQAAIKREGTTYLPHPNMVDQTSRAQVARYNAYRGRAEFDSSCGQTKTELIGAFTRVAHEIDLPDAVAYIESDSDGDWLSLSDSINVTFANCLEAKFHILLAEYESGEIPEGAQISVAQKREMKARAKIVHYPREALVNWAFGVVNGRMQLTHAVLETESSELNENFVQVKVKTQLLLALDENGLYRQKEIIQRGIGDISAQEGDWIEIKAMNERLDYIPIEIVIDERMPAGKMPKATGYLSAIALKDIARYQVNADLKEKLALLQDTINSTGWTEQAWEEFKRINGRDFIATGAGVSNQFPTDVEVDIMKMSADGDAHFKYIEQNEKQTRALGGRYETEPAQVETATEAEIKSAKENSVLTMLANNIEQSYRRLVCYCAAFEGLLLLPEDVNITINKQFSSNKLTPEQATAIKSVYDSGLISKPTAIKMLKNGGFDDPDLTVEEELDLIEEDTPDPLPVTPTPGGQNTVEVQQ